MSSRDIIRLFSKLHALGAGGDRAGAEEVYSRIINAPESVKEECIFKLKNVPEEHKRAFISLNNSMVEKKLPGRNTSKFLVLLPFCVQQTECPHRIIWKVSNCRRCGKCSVGSILEFCEARKIEVKVAVRGLFAPKFISELKPDVTVAVACENELVAGMLRAADFLCYGITNERPQGYCINTTVSVDLVIACLSRFTDGRS